MTETSAAVQRGNASEPLKHRPLQPSQKALGGRWNSLIATNTAIAIGSRIHGSKSEIYVNGMCVELQKGSTSCPSIVIVNGEPKFAESREILQNPTVIVETISNDVDPLGRAEKLEGYLALPSIKECILVRSDQMRIEHYARQNAKQWLYKIYDERDDVVSIDTLNCKVSVAEIYAKVDLKLSGLNSRAIN
ncbi:MAG TPA: Uma2 family endonuclease [Pyrinomonadaceae bacterium]|nr:Uma2 family endonuclease [Pyrinomonadaceae bacterium]